MISTLIQLHKTLFLWIHSFTLNYPEYHHITYIIAEKFDIYIVIVAFMVLVFFIYQSIEHTSWKHFNFLIKEGFRIVTAVGVSWGASYIIKQITHLPRPYLRFPDEVTRLFDYGGFDSFPSGHATLLMAFGVMIFLHHKHIGWIFIILAVLVSLARVAAGIHFPIDIIIGWIIGGGLSLLIYNKMKFK
ncbi:MAG: phosphatase PAP2 family protein [Candidatus Pacebacteria bacterium]|nr:phosphatase PAP2 family protein [Candidatus Paceibacterota bacterium]